MDKKNRRDFFLGSLYINPTKYCNLGCRHCWLSPPRKDSAGLEKEELTAAEIIRIVENGITLGLSSVKLTGGEPLLRKDIGRILEFCGDKGIGVFIETNGTLITEKMAGEFRKYSVEQVSVSIDSPYEDKNDMFRGCSGAFSMAMRGIDRLLDAGIKPQVIMSLYRDNIEDFPVFLRLMRDKGISDIKINVICPIGRGNALHGQDGVPGIPQVLDFADRLREMKEGFEGSVFLDIPMAFKTLEEIQNREYKVCALKSILGVLPDGSVSMCGIGFLEEGLLFGNAREDPSELERIWDNDPVLEHIRKDVPSGLEGICGKCVFKNICQGSCRAEVYHETGGVLGPYWFCQEAYEAGLFPKTRVIPEKEAV